MSEAERDVEIALAEYGALRDEILAARGLQKNVISIGLTALGGLFALAYAKGGRTEILLVVPPLGLALCLFQVAESFHVHRIGTYIRERIWPYLQQRSTYPYSWENEHHYTSNRISQASAAILTDGIFPAVLIGASVWALVESSPPVSSVALWANCVAVALTFLVPVLYGLLIKGMHVESDSSSPGG